MQGIEKTPTIEDLKSKLDAAGTAVKHAQEKFVSLADTPENTDARKQAQVNLSQAKNTENALAREFATAISKEIETLDAELIGRLDKTAKILLMEDGQTADLNQDARFSECAFVTLKGETVLESIRRLSALVDHRHIVEEMDSRTYQGRVGEGFKRLQLDGSQLKQSVDASEGEIQSALKRLSTIERNIRDFKKGGISPETTCTLETLKRKLQELAHILETYRKRLDRHLGKFCGQKNVDYVLDATAHAAKAAEQPLWFKILVLANVVFAVFLLKRMIVLSGNLFLLDKMGIVLAVTGVVAYLVSIRVGKLYRQTRVAGLNRRMMAALRSVFELRTGVWGKFLTKTPYEFAFPRLQLLDVDPAERPAFKEPTPLFRRHPGTAWFLTLGGMGLTFLTSFVVAVLPAALVALLLPPGAAGTAHLIGQGPDGQACKLDEGQIVYATADALYFKSGQGGFAGALFPEYFARNIDRNTVHAVKAGNAADLPNADCSTLVRTAPTFRTATYNLSLLDNVFRHVRITNAGGTGATLTDATAQAIDRLGSRLKELTQIRIQVFNPTISVGAGGTEGLALHQQLQIFVEGRPAYDGPRKNAMLLPLFREPVVGVDGYDAAFDRGFTSLDEDRLDEPGTREMLTKLVEPLARCIDTGSTVEIDVIGFASRTWRNAGKYSIPRLNHNLAEGRRMALLAWLGSNTGDLANDRLFVSAGQGRVPLNDAVARKIRRFDDYDGLHRELLNWVGDSGDTSVSGQMRELLSRSAVLRIVNVDGGTCGLKFATDEDQIVRASAD